MKSIFSLLFIFAACEKDLGPKVKGVQITVGSDSITITNGTDDELRFFPVNQASLAMLNWAPYCLDSGLIISAGDKETIAFDAIETEIRLEEIADMFPRLRAMLGRIH